MSTKTLTVKEPLESENVDQSVDSPSTNIETKNDGQPSEDSGTIQSNKVPNKQELMTSLTNVVDYITDTVAERVSQNVTAAQSGEKPQNGFDSVNIAAEMMAKSGGKRKKTRKFKLTNKKSRRNVKST